MQAYREAARIGLRDWAQSTALSPMEENDTEETFVSRCVSAMNKASDRPNWKVDNARLIISMEIRKRAKAIYAKYHPEEETAEAAAAMDEGEEQESGEEGEEDEDGEVGEEGETSDSPKTTDAPAGNNKGKQQKGKKRGKQQVRKKGTAAKQGLRKGPQGNRAKRGGRGGATKSN